jgi:predicted metal-dependent hydrolase
MQEIMFQNQSIPYTLRKNSKARRLTMRRTTSQGLVVTQPRGISDSTVQQFLQSKASWILKHYSRKQTLQESNPNITTHTREHFLDHKQAAYDLCVKKVEQWSHIIPYDYKTIKVKSLKTKRWSCSSKKNLNFNYKILFLPETVQDYLIVHEMCHLKEMNHSNRFRDLVEQYYGPHQQARKELRSL